jgi:exosome complex RNA-binding protein Rrp42 (RNase PH superfamily)
MQSTHNFRKLEKVAIQWITHIRPLYAWPMEYWVKLFFIYQVLECGGNLYDALSMAVKAALHDTRYEK